MRILIVLMLVSAGSYTVLQSLMLTDEILGFFKTFFHFILGFCIPLIPSALIFSLARNKSEKLK